jgi:glycosyltransferase involved in cell wall biosynthesis
MHVVLSLVEGGGAEKLAYEMVRAGNPSSEPPVICCLQMVGALGEKLRQEGINVYCRSKNQKKGVDFGLVQWLSRVIRTEKIQVIHAHQYTPMFYAVSAAFLAGDVKVIYTEHGRLYPDKKRWKRYLFNPLLARYLDHIVSISESTKKAMVAVDNLPVEKIRVVHNGIDPKLFGHTIDINAKRRSLCLDERCPIVGTAARLEEIKNIPMMLKAFKIILEKIPDARLIIAGRGSREEELKAFAMELGIAEKVLFIGLRLDLPEIYQLFNVFLLSSFTEGISITLLEAMASGIPPVVTDVGGNPEVVVDGETGFLVPLDDDRLMADRVITLLENPEKAAIIGLKAKARVEEHFSFTTMMTDYFRLYGTTK